MYIDINLLPQAFRPKKVLIKFDYKFMLVLVIILGVAGVGGYYKKLQKDIETVNRRITAIRKEEARLKDTVAMDAQVKALTVDVEKRVGIIKDLTTGSDVRFTMLEHVNSVIPENLWLISISESVEGNIVSYNFEGMSYSKEKISDFLAGLKKFEKFTTVSLESIRPAPLEIKDAYSYVVKVNLVSSKIAEPEPEANTSRRRRPRKK